TPTALAGRSGVPVGHQVVQPGRRCRLDVGVEGGGGVGVWVVRRRRVDLGPAIWDVRVHGLMSAPTAEILVRTEDTTVTGPCHRRTDPCRPVSKAPAGPHGPGGSVTRWCRTAPISGYE